MSDSHHEEVDLDVYHRNSQKQFADRGEYWYLWLVVPLLTFGLTLAVWGIRGLGLWLIAAVVVLLLLLVEIESVIFPLIVLGLGTLVGFIYFIVVYQTL